MKGYDMEVYTKKIKREKQLQWETEHAKRMENKMNQLKTCAKCRQIEPVSAYGTDKTNKSGLQSWCRACKAAWARQYYATAKGKLAHNNGRKYHKTNRQRQAELLDAAKEVLPILYRYSKILQLDDDAQSIISKLSTAVHQIEIV